MLLLQFEWKRVTSIVFDSIQVKHVDNFDKNDVLLLFFSKCENYTGNCLNQGNRESIDRELK